MTPNVRIFASEEGATEAHQRLVDAGYDTTLLILTSAAAGKESEVVTDAIRRGLLPDNNSRVALRNLKQGRSLVAVRAPFGAALEAIEILEAGDVVDAAVIRSYSTTSPSPFSDALNLPVLANFSPSTGLVSNSWSFSSMFGMKLLSSKAAPFSAIIKLPVVPQPKPRSWRRSFGFPMLSKSAAPFSSLFSMRVLSKGGEGEWKSSFGMPLLINKAAPFSALFGMKELVAARGEKKK